MTNKEAKEVLQEQIDRYGQEYDAEGIEALEIAINVLEQQTCEDAISRKAVKKLKKYSLSYDTNTTIPKSGIFVKIADIAELPPVTPWFDWIPVSEKLPEPLTAVLLTVRYKSSGCLTYQMGYWEDALEKWERWLEIGTLDDEFEILAWMELPEKYEEDTYE